MSGASAGAVQRQEWYVSNTLVYFGILYEIQFSVGFFLLHEPYWYIPFCVFIVKGPQESAVGARAVLGLMQSSQGRTLRGTCYSWGTCLRRTGWLWWCVFPCSRHASWPCKETWNRPWRAMMCVQACCRDSRTDHRGGKNSLLKLKDYRQCLECTEVALNEALQQLNSVPVSSHTAKEEWFSTITTLLGGFEVCFTEDPQLLSNVNHYTSMARLANNLIRVNTHTNILGRDKVCLETENYI
ncbi:unnamed protein product [Oncorhynchus mykiss]|uniref:Uncharacterized protein n=1 Tax=Oncorhynchus mykiss TaxID=8022 RepID=A0A060Y2X2_ONCMY|nr:unnamed protein product [Oncorhynchus mykiss]